MIFFILTKAAFKEIETMLHSTKSPVWVSGGVLTEEELLNLRSNGMEITSFSYKIDPFDREKVFDAVFVIEEHHPGERIWVEIIAKPSLLSLGRGKERRSP